SPGLYKVAPGNVNVVVTSASEGFIVLEASVSGANGISHVSGRSHVSTTMDHVIGYTLDTIAAVVVSSSGERLKSSGVKSVIGDPKVTVFDAAAAVVDSNDDWETRSEKSRISAVAGLTSKKAAGLIHSGGVGETFTVSAVANEAEVLVGAFFAELKTTTTGGGSGPWTPPSGAKDYVIESTDSVTFEDKTLQSDTTQNLFVPNDKPKFAYGKLEGDTNYKYYSCGAFTTVDQGKFLETIQASTFTDLLTPMPAAGDVCKKIGESYCSPSGYFSNNYFGSTDKNVKVRASLTGEKGCCPTGMCYSSGVCKANNVVEGAAKCMDGVWVATTNKKYSPDGTDEGYCPQASQCLVSSTGTGTATDPRCIDDGKTFKGYYCGAGTWTSMTAVVADQLTKFAASKGHTSGVLYCDEYPAVLAYIGAVGAKNLNTILKCGSTESLASDCFTNFCVFDPKGSAAPFVASSVLKPIDTITDVSVVLSGVTCNKASTSPEKCGASNWYFNGRLGVLVYSKEGFSLFGWVSNVWKSMVSTVINLFSSAPADSSFKLIPQSSLFTKLYYNTITGSQPLIAFSESRGNVGDLEPKTYYVFSYKLPKTASFDLCRIVDAHNKKLSATETPVSCQYTDNTYVIAGDESAYALWSPLTAALRLE
ncbi:MAG TPA: hypothetical protein VK158_04220, partial [Acidobacteriota bacterium]|nr:hypothetical protein [Acidobacteriota bacterium]